MWCYVEMMASVVARVNEVHYVTDDRGLTSLCLVSDANPNNGIDWAIATIVVNAP